MYVKIIDQGECFSTTMEFVDTAGVYANKSEWEKYNFYPRNGMVGEVIKQTPTAYIVKIMENIYVPMTEHGIEEISYEEYKRGLRNNTCDGMTEHQRFVNDYSDNACRFPDMRMFFREDIIQNIIRLTCDYKRSIFLPDLEKSAAFYAVDICLAYRKEHNRELDWITVRDITNQVCDVYMELFEENFFESSRERCMSQVKNIVKDPISARQEVDSYYQKVNERYGWS